MSQIYEYLTKHGRPNGILIQGDIRFTPINLYRERKLLELDIPKINQEAFERLLKKYGERCKFKVEKGPEGYILKGKTTWEKATWYINVEERDNISRVLIADFSGEYFRIILKLLENLLEKLGVDVGRTAEVIPSRYSQ